MLWRFRKWKGTPKLPAEAMRGEDCADKPRGREALVDGERRGLHRDFSSVGAVTPTRYE